MIKSSRAWLIMGFMIALGILTTARPAQAQFVAVRVTQGMTVITVADGDPDDENPAPNAVTAVINTLTGITTTVDTAISNTPGTTTGASLDLSFLVSAVGAAGGSVTIEATATGYTQPPAGPLPLTLVSSIGGTVGAGSTLEAEQFVDPGDGQFVQTGPSVAHGPFGAGPYSDSGSVQFTNPAGAYSITERVDVTVAGGVNVSGNFESIVAVPAPGGLVLALMSLPAFGLNQLWRRLRKAKV
jgi:hypothetical protein